MRQIPILFCGFMVLSLPGVAASQCATVDPVMVPQIRLDPLDASGPGEVVQPFVLTFRRAGVGADPILIRYQLVDEDSSIQSRVGVAEGPTLEWQGADSTRDIGAFRSEAYALLRSDAAVIAGDELATQQTIRLRLTNLRADLAAGVYREQFTVRYWCGDAESTLPFEAQGLVTVTVAVPNVLSANVAGASQHGEIDFLDFALLRRSLQVSVRSTGPYEVSARSLNGGVLLRENGRPGDPADRVSYSVAFDSQSLTVDTVATHSMPRAGLLGRQIPLEVEVEPTQAKRAGRYGDTLLLTLAPVN